MLAVTFTYSSTCRIRSCGRNAGSNKRTNICETLTVWATQLHWCAVLARMSAENNQHAPQRQTPALQESMTSLTNAGNIDDVKTLQSVDPLTLFNCWFERAEMTDGIHLATSATLATASRYRPTASFITFTNIIVNVAAHILQACRELCRHGLLVRPWTRPAYLADTFSRSPGFPVDKACGHRRPRHWMSRLHDCPLSATERFPSPRHEHGTVCQLK